MHTTLTTLEVIIVITATVKEADQKSIKSLRCLEKVGRLL